MCMAEWLLDAARKSGGPSRGPRNACYGRRVCTDCPREHYAPPFLPFGLAVHIRQHRRRFPSHQFAFWCWLHLRMESEAEGASPMIQAAQYPRIGGCQRDKTLFYMGSNGGLCPFCAQPPDFVANLPVATAPFIDEGAGIDAYSTAPQGDAGAADGMPAGEPLADTTAPAPLVDIPTACPQCGADLRAVVSDTSFELLPAANGEPEGTPAAEDAPQAEVDESPLDDAAGSAGAEGTTTPFDASANDPAPSPADAEAPA
jgi:hypothetical protein